MLVGDMICIFIHSVIYKLTFKRIVSVIEGDNMHAVFTSAQNITTLSAGVYKMCNLEEHIF